MPELAGRLRVEIVGDLLPVVRAFGIMSAALAVYGHEFTDEEMTVIGTAAEALSARIVEPSATDFDVAANFERPPCP